MNDHFFSHIVERDQSRMDVDHRLKANIAHALRLRSPRIHRNRFADTVRALRWPLAAAFAGLLLFVTYGLQEGKVPTAILALGGGDDWQYRAHDDIRERASPLSGRSVSLSSGLSNALSLGTAAVSNVSGQAQSFSDLAMPAAGDLGYAVGGAKDIANFRENIKNNFLPKRSDVTFEGLFYDYAFDTGLTQPCAELFCPSYARAVTRDPLTGVEETYLAVGLNSNLKEQDFKRPKTDFVVVLDISGSMGSPFNQYYYDRSGTRVMTDHAESSKTKIQVAAEALGALVDQLKPDDRLGIVLFSDSATVAKPLGLVGDTNRALLKQHLRELKPTNGTNMSSGLERGTIMLTEHAETDNGYAKRLIFLTDAMPNQGAVGAGDLQRRVEQNAERNIGTTIVGIGVDFQSELVEALTKARGANYLSVHSAEDFKRRLGDEFDFLVTPLVYDLRLKLEGSGYAIDQVYGSPDADESNGEVMHVRTLFPSKTENGETRGGLILIKLRKTGETAALSLRVSYEDVRGKSYQNESTVSFSGVMSEGYDTSGVRKGVLLARYGELLKQWLAENEEFYSEGAARSWERTSRPLATSQVQRELFIRFAGYLRTELEAIGDKKLEQEVAVLDHLVASADILRPVDGDDWMAE